MGAMATWGGRLVATAALLPAPLVLAALAALAGCAGTQVDRAMGVRADVGRLPAVAEVSVAGPSADRGAQVAVTVRSGAGVGEVVRVARRVAEAGGDGGWSTYRLELREADHPEDLLVGDEAFATGGARSAVEAFRRTSDALLGPLTWTVAPGSTTVAVDAGGGLAHDVQEAARTAYGDRTTTWRFVAGAGTVLVDGRVGPAEQELVERVQRSVASPALPVPADHWWLEARDDHVLLDLEVALPGAPVAGADLVPERYADAVGRLAGTALDAVRGGRPRLAVPLWLRLREGADVFAWWRSDRPPVPGRDPLGRGWDRRLHHLTAS